MILFLLLLFPSILNAEMIISNVYLLYPDSFTVTNLNIVKSYRHKTDPKGFRNTELLPATNTNYYILEITTRNSIENTVIQNAVSNGKLFRMAERRYEKYFDSRAGRELTDISEYWYHRPKEITDAFRVDDSTP